MDEWPGTIRDEEALEDALSRPDDALRADLAGAPGDMLVLGAAGKMGPTPCRTARCADPGWRVIAVARSPSPDCGTGWHPGASSASRPT